MNKSPLGTLYANFLFVPFVLLASMVPALAQDEEIVVDEELRVHHYLLEVRAYDRKGILLEDLKSDDWRVTTRYKELKVVSSQWVDMVNPRPTDRETTSQLTVGSPPESGLFEWKEPVGQGRLIMLYFQGESGFQNRTFVNVTRYFKQLLGKLEPQDRVAVASLDSHLKLHCDFTGDWEVVLKALENAAMRKPAKVLEPGKAPSVARHFDFDKARETHATDLALKLVADALVPVKGPKTLVYVGYGMGRIRFGPHVVMPLRYEKTLDALNKANLTVFAYGYAPNQQRQVLGGLRQVAWDTGGEYLGSMKDLVDSMKGYHLIEIQTDEPIKRGKFKIRLRDQYGTFTYRMANLDEGMGD